MNLGKFLTLDIHNPLIRVFVPVGIVQGLLAYAILYPFTGDVLEKIFFRGERLGGVAIPALIGAGLAFFLSYRREYWARAAVAAGFFGVAHAALWWLASPGGDYYESYGWWIGPWYVCSLIFAYITLPFLQIYVATGRWEFPYATLYNHAWNNGQIVGSSYVLTGLFFAVMFLAGGLLDILKVDFFLKLMGNGLFAVTAYFTVKAIGYAIARENTGMVVALRRLCLGFCSFLAPILAGFAIVFAVILPFAGLEPVWQTRVATPIFLSFAMVTVFFFNAIFQDGASENYFTRINGRLQQIALLILPIFGVLACYSTWLRIDQYGVTVDRYYAMVLGGLMSGYGVVYAIAALRPAKATPMIQRSNITLALVAVLLALGAHLPVVGAASMSAASQYNLIAAGKFDPEKFDLWYLKGELGAPGARAFARLKEIKNHPQQEALEKAIKRAEEQKSRWDRPVVTPATDLRDIRSYMAVHGRGDLPSAFLDMLVKVHQYDLDHCYFRENRPKCVVTLVDLDRDGRNEIIWVRNWAVQMFVEDIKTNSWKSSPYQGRILSRNGYSDAMKYLAEAREFRLQRAQYDELIFDDKVKIGFVGEGDETAPAPAPDPEQPPSAR